jgi:hypothetical protein
MSPISGRRARLMAWAAGLPGLLALSACGTMVPLSQAAHLVTVSSDPEGMDVYAPAVGVQSGQRDIRKIGKTPITFPVDQSPDPSATMLLVLTGKDVKVPVRARMDHCYHVILKGPKPVVLEDGKPMLNRE